MVQNVLIPLKKEFFKKFNFTNFIQLHFDEKWIYNDYIKKYVNIEPSISEFLLFINSIVNKINYKLIITTGKKTPDILVQLKSGKK